MSKDIPTRERSTRERGTYAGHNEDPTLASYLSSLFFLLSVPTFVAIAYGGAYMGYYGEGAIVPIFGGLLVFAICVAFAAMHFKR
ncbi:hypothetical protein AUR64_09945 [Haloprofundus marisrubri]|uniref:Transporter n=1 Tax=Haloprofundus marisrubri TaxID=1514971 RepID=A0A0W1RB73_9EURY|nr:hypothetical protein [Haloprofundus marisrubri]KTG10490.1 hypothetical protein AUR64_09945 [Haloprofundus marisrubri]